MKNALKLLIEYSLDALMIIFGILIAKILSQDILGGFGRQGLNFFLTHQGLWLLVFMCLLLICIFIKVIIKT